MKKHLLSLLLPSFLFAQSTFLESDYQVLIGEDYNDKVYKVIEDDKKNITVIGFSETFKSSPERNRVYYSAFDYLKDEQSDNGRHLRILKLDQNAEVIFDTRLTSHSFSEGKSIIKSTDNGYVALGKNANSELLIIKASPDGDIFFEKSYKKFSTYLPEELISLRNGNLAVLGTTRTDVRNKEFTKGLGKKDISLNIFDKYGNEIAFNKFGDSNDDFAKSFLEKSDRNFLICGYSKQETMFELVLLETTDMAGRKWMKHLLSQKNLGDCKIAKSHDGNYLLATTFENKEGKNNVRLLKVNEFGDVLWKRTFINRADTHINEVKILPNSNIIAIGSINHANNENDNAILYHYSSNGKLIWTKEFGGMNQDEFTSAEILKNSNIALAGNSNSFKNKNFDMWILKLTPNATLVQKQKVRPSAKALYEIVQKKLKKPMYNISFRENRVIITPNNDALLYDVGEYTLKTKGKQFVTKLFDSLFTELNKHDFLPFVEEIRVNGFTSTTWQTKNSDRRYLNNAELSQKRSFFVIKHIVSSQKDMKRKEWLKQKLSANGYSYSQIISDTIYNKQVENRVKSRRVEIEILLKRSNK